MPLLPRPWPFPETFSGEAHSTCSWQSPNDCFDVTPPPRTVAKPSFTSHFSPPCQADMLLPSNSTIASDGGPPGGPGSTTFGSGQTLPLRYSSLSACQVTVADASSANTTTIRFVADIAKSPLNDVD